MAANRNAYSDPQFYSNFNPYPNPNCYQHPNTFATDANAFSHCNQGERAHTRNCDS